MRADEEFFNLHRHDFVRVAVAVPTVRVADPAYSAREITRLVARAAERQAAAVLFPEFCISAYSCEDLFHQSALLAACESALLSLRLAWGFGMGPLAACTLVLQLGLRARLGGLIILPGPVFTRGKLEELTTKYKMPAISSGGSLLKLGA